MEKRYEFLPHSQPCFDGQEEQAVIEALRSGWWSRGPKTAEFEERFREFTGAKYALAVNSCTAAMHLALMVNGIGAGDEVIVPAMTFCSTANVVVNVGATPVLADVLPENGLIDPEDIEHRITPRTKAIMPVHYAGRAVDLDRINAIAKAHGLVVIEDAAHAIGTRYKGTVIGGSGNEVAFSFYATKNISTGEGGMFVTNDPEKYEQARVLSLHGMSRNAWNRYNKGGTWHYDVLCPGYKYNMTDIAASLGLVQLEKLPRFNEIRRRYAAIYEEAFTGMQTLRPLSEGEGSETCWHLYIIRVEEEHLGITRDEFIDILTNEYNIGLSVHFIPLHLHPFYQQTYGLKKSDYPKASLLFKGLITLPLYPGMKEDEVRYVAQAVREVARIHAK